MENQRCKNLGIQNPETLEWTAVLKALNDEKSLFALMTRRLSRVGGKGMMLYDFNSAGPVYTDNPPALMSAYWDDVGPNRDSALKLAIRTGRPVGYRAHFRPHPKAPAAHDRIWDAASEIGIVDALGIFSAPSVNSYYYICLGFETPVDRLAPAEKFAIQHESAIFLRHLDSLRPRRLKPPLTAREAGVLRLIAAGRTDKQIAQEFNVATSTVRTFAERCFVKLGVRSRVEAAIAAARLGLTIKP